MTWVSISWVYAKSPVEPPVWTKTTRGRLGPRRARYVRADARTLCRCRPDRAERPPSARGARSRPDRPSSRSRSPGRSCCRTQGGGRQAARRHPELLGPLRDEGVDLGPRRDRVVIHARDVDEDVETGERRPEPQAGRRPARARGDDDPFDVEAESRACAASSSDPLTSPSMPVGVRSAGDDRRRARRRDARAARRIARPRRPACRRCARSPRTAGRAGRCPCARSRRRRPGTMRDRTTSHARPSFAHAAARSGARGSTARRRTSRRASAPSASARPSRNSSLRVLLPPPASPVQSSRFSQTRGPPTASRSRSHGCSGVGQCPSWTRGCAARMSIGVRHAENATGRGWCEPAADGAAETRCPARAPCRASASTPRPGGRDRRARRSTGTSRCCPGSPP